MTKQFIFGALALILLASPVLALAAFSSLAPTALGSCSTRTNNLTLGSTGASVTCLQQGLITAGFSIPAGATGYFGTQTRAAVASWQSSKNITPAIGYFGSLSRAAWALGGSTTISATTVCGLGALFNIMTGLPCTSTSGGRSGGGGSSGSGGGSATANATVVVTESNNIVTCSALSAFNNSSQDAWSTIKGCIDNTPAGGILELPPGAYVVSQPLHITRAMTVRSVGMSEASGHCTDATCASISPSTNYSTPDAFFNVDVNGVTIDHLIIDGNKTARQATGSSQMCVNKNGRSVLMSCSSCGIQSSIIRNAWCIGAVDWVGQGYDPAHPETSKTSDISFINNQVIGNGERTSADTYFSDGVAIFDTTRAMIKNNTFSNNTDIDLVIGGCPNCTIQGNSFTHSIFPNGTSHAALALSPWPATIYTSDSTNHVVAANLPVRSSGDFSGTQVTKNTIDCTLNPPNYFGGNAYVRGCGFGIEIGATPWEWMPGGQEPPTFGDAATLISNNTITNARLGLLIDSAHAMTIQNNSVSATDNYFYGSTRSPFFPLPGAIFPNGAIVIDSPTTCPLLDPSQSFINVSTSSLQAVGNLNPVTLVGNTPNYTILSHRGCITGDN